MTKAKTDSDELFIHQHQDCTVKWCQLYYSEIIIKKQLFLLKLMVTEVYLQKLGVVAKELNFE